MTNNPSKYEMDIIIMYLKEMSQKDIKNKLGCSKTTVAEHIRTLRIDAGLPLNPERNKK
uniref:Putative DNA binding, helix-turn-helix domain containing protein n=1 Tax=viral metagenome TaxID=1070528 RepID=A0A6M3LSN5_9ZZZZ